MFDPVCLFSITHTDNKGLFKLGSVFIIPGWSASCVYGPRAGAEQRRFCFTQSAALPARGADRREELVQRVLTTPTRPKTAKFINRGTVKICNMM